MLRTLIAAGLLVLVTALPTAAQNPFAINPITDELPPKPLLPHPLERKELAKAKREAVEAEPRRLKEEKLTAARIGFEARLGEFFAGRGTLTFLDEMLREMRDSRLALAPDNGERARAHEEYWWFARWIEFVNEARNDAGRIPVKDYLQSVYWRLDAELRLQEFTPWAGWTDPIGFDPGHVKRFARAKFSGAQATRARLLQERRDTIHEAWLGRIKEFLAARGNLDFLLEKSRLLLDAELSVALSDEERLAAYEFYWSAQNYLERLNRARYDNGRIPILDFAQSQDRSLQADAWLKEAQAKVPAERWVPAGVGFWLFDWDQPSLLNSEFKLYAKAKERIRWADQRDLAERQAAAAAVEFEARTGEFLCGRGTLDFLLESATRVLETELALSESDDQRLAIRERQLARLHQIEKVNRKRYHDAKIPIQDYIQSRYHRLQAALLLNDAWRKAQPKP